MQKIILMPVIAFIGGVLGLIIRRGYLSRAFEPGTGLPISGVPMTWAMAAIVLVTLAALALCCRGTKRTFDRNYTAAFAPLGNVSLTLQLAGAFLLMAAGFINIAAYLSAPTDYMTGGRTVSFVRILVGVLCLGASAGIFFAAKNMRKGKPVASVGILLPGFAACLWAMANYRSWAQDPVLSRYVLQVAAVLLSMLACCFSAGFAFSKGKPSLTLFLCGSAAACCIMVLLDGTPLYDEAIYLAMTFYMLSLTASLADNATRPEPNLCTASSCEGCAGCSPDTQKAAESEKTSETPTNPEPETPGEAPESTETKE